MGETKRHTRGSARRRMGILVVLGLVALLVVVGLAAGTRQQACVACHRSAADALAKTEHASTPCLRCHLEAGAWSYPDLITRQVTRMYPAALAGRGVSGPVAPTSSAACAGCHGAMLRSTKPQEAKGLRILHRACASGAASCDDCHSTTAHGDSVRNVRGPVMDDCIACHDAQGATKACTACHPGRIEKSAPGVGTFSVTHGPNWRQTHGLGRLATCNTCHRDDSCVRCHGVVVPHPADFGTTHGSFAKRDRAACLTCHKSEQFCSSCHGVEMPHPAGFLAKHSSVASDVADPACSRCHERADCERCHERHVHPGGARGIPVPPRVPSGGTR